MVSQGCKGNSCAPTILDLHALGSVSEVLVTTPSTQRTGYHQGQILEEILIPVSSAMPRQEDMSCKVVGSDADKIIFFVKFQFKCTCSIILVLN